MLSHQSAPLGCCGEGGGVCALIWPCHFSKAVLVSVGLCSVWLCMEHRSRASGCRDVVLQDFSDMVAAKAAQQKRKAAERKEKAKKKDSFKF